MSIATEPKEEKNVIYEVTLGAGDISETIDVNEALEVLREHLDAAARSGRGLRIVLYDL